MILKIFIHNRIAELIKRQARKRMGNKKNAAHQHNKKYQQPTLSNNPKVMYNQPDYSQSDHMSLLANAQVQPYSSPPPPSTYYHAYNNQHQHHTHQHNNNYYYS